MSASSASPMRWGWGEVAIPSHITSDQGPQFVSSFLRTIGARLGIRQAFSQAYQPQGNNRAEVAVWTVINVLRKILGRAFHSLVGESTTGVAFQA